jgi:hypothetical protein
LSSNKLHSILAEPVKLAVNRGHTPACHRFFSKNKSALIDYQGAFV